jgi:hypothetical protein
VDEKNNKKIINVYVSYKDYGALIIFAVNERKKANPKSSGDIPICINKNIYLFF